MSDQWLQRPPAGVETGAKRRKSNWAKTYDDLRPKRHFPWIVEISDDAGLVIGIVCKICRQRYGEHPELFSTVYYTGKIHGAWINFPINRPWGEVIDKCLTHEFGSKILKERQGRSDIAVFRRRIMGNLHNNDLGRQSHMHFVRENTAVVDPVFIDSPLSVRNLETLCLLASLHVRYVHARTSAQMELKIDLDHRSRYHSSCPLMQHYNQHMHNYTNPRNITEMNKALLLTVHLGILKEFWKYYNLT